MNSAAPKLSDPYAPPKATVEGAGHRSERSPWVAVLLAVLSPVYAMCYVAAGWRALGYFAVSVGLLPIAIILTTFIDIPMPAVEVLGTLALRVVGSVDGYRRAKAWSASTRLPWYARWPGLVPIMAVLFVGLLALRAFIVEPFRIPSEAMVPTLVVGDYIVVDKHAYGLRLPSADRPLIMLARPKRGDVAVFLYPEKPEIKYVKRVVGLPGDRVTYLDKRLSINGEDVRTAPAPGQNRSDPTDEYVEDLGGRRHRILINRDAPPVHLGVVRSFPHRDACEYNDRGFVCTVPEGHYFVMGDNRDTSSDSRYWGFVPEANFLGRAFMVCASRGRPERLGMSVE